MDWKLLAILLLKGTVKNSYIIVTVVIHSCFIVTDVEVPILLCHQVVWPRERLQRPSHGLAWTQSGGPVQFLLTSFHNENSPDAGRPGSLHLNIRSSAKYSLSLKNTFSGAILPLKMNILAVTWVSELDSLFCVIFGGFYWYWQIIFPKCRKQIYVCVCICIYTHKKQLFF